MNCWLADHLRRRRRRWPGLRRELSAGRAAPGDQANRASLLHLMWVRSFVASLSRATVSRAANMTQLKMTATQLCSTLRERLDPRHRFWLSDRFRRRGHLVGY